MKKYCEKCDGEILDVNNKRALERAILQALLLECGVHIAPRPTYCRCNQGLEPLVLGVK